MKFLITTLTDYMKVSSNIEGFEKIILFYTEEESSIPITMIENFVSKPIELVKMKRKEDIPYKIAYFCGLYSMQHEIRLLGDTCLQIYGAVLNDNENIAMLEKPKKKTSAKKQTSPEKVSPSKSTTDNTSEKKVISEEEASEIVKEYAPKKRTKKIQTEKEKESVSETTKVVIVERKVAEPKGKKISPAEIKEFFTKYDTEEFSFSDSAMTIYEAFRDHFLKKMDLKVALKDRLIIDTRVNAAYKVIEADKKAKPHSMYDDFKEFVLKNK